MNRFNDPVNIQGGIISCDGATVFVQNEDDKTLDLVAKHIYADAVYLTSDKAKKEDIEPLLNDRIFEQLIPYKYKLNGKIHFGLLLENCPAEISSNNKLDYTSIIAILLLKIKDLENKVNELRHTVTEKCCQETDHC